MSEAREHRVQDPTETFRATVELPRVPVRATNLDGGRDLRELRRYVRRIPDMDLDEIRRIRTRIWFMTDEDRSALSVSEQRGLYMLIRVLRNEEVRRLRSSPQGR